MRQQILMYIVALATMSTSFAQTTSINATKTTATITIDGNPNESAWQVTTNVTRTIIGTPNNVTKYGVLWNNQYLYIAYTVTDASKYNDSQNEWDDDGVEVYIDADNNGGTTYGTNDRQFHKGWNTTTISEKNGRATGVLHAWANTATGYTVEIAIPWSNIGISNPLAGRIIGFDIANNDDDNGSTRESQVMWVGDGNNWQYPRNFGDLILVDVQDIEAPTVPGGLAANSITQTSLQLTWNPSTDNIGVAGYDVYLNGVKINTSLVTTTNYSVTGLSANTFYSFYVVARDAAGNTSANSTAISFTMPDIQEPTAPGSLVALNITQTSVDLDWNASTDNVGVTGYDVYQDNVKINPSPVTATDYSVTGLTASTSYSFYIKAADAAENISANSNTVTIATLAPPDTEAPSAPSDLVASGITFSSFVINWSAATDNIAVTGYDIYINNTKANTATVTGTSYTVTGLSELTTYSVYIRAKDQAGNFTNSDPVDVTTTEEPDTQAPTAPAGLAASAVTENSLTLTWSASTDNKGVAGYNIYQNSTKINSVPVTALTYDVTGLSGATLYTYFVRAVDAAENISGNSNSISVYTLDVVPPSAPASLASSAVGPTSLTLNWSASTDNVGVAGYDVYRNNVKINSSLVTSTTYNVTGLTASTAYSFFVIALDAAGNASSNSNTISVTTTAGGCTGTGTINYHRFTNITGTAVTNLTSSASYPNSPAFSGTLTSFETPTNVADNIGSRIFGYICPPATGSYTFWIASDDNSELWLSTTSSSANRVRIAYHTQYTASREWNKYTTQKSAAITLTAGQVYFVEALAKDGTQSDNLAVGWARPGQSTTAPSEVIPGMYLIPQIPTVPDTEVPSVPSNLLASAITQSSLTLTWTASTDNVGVAGYDVYRNGTKINTSLVTTLSYSVTGLTASTAYSFYIRASDAAGNISANSNTVNATTAAGCTGTGTINYHRYTNVTGTTVASLTSSASYPNNPNFSGTLTSFETPTNLADNIGSRVFGYICPPTTGAYTFWIASDDNSELWLSTTSSSANRVRIAYHTEWTNSREWNKYTTQKSAAITLTAGQIYFVEALAKDGAQGDNLAVGWARPGQATTTPSEVIPGMYLIPQIPSVPDDEAPTAPASLTATNIAQTSCTLNWTAATDNITVAGYDVYRNGTKINSSLVTGLSYNVTGLTGNTTYAFTVKAKDAAGNESSFSPSVNVTTLAANPGSETFTQRTVIANQRMPHDLVYGPDNNLWFTERFAGRVSFVNPATGAKTIVLTLGSKMQRSSGQDGLMGLALHPEFTSGKPYVYISYTYEVTSGNVRKTRIERYTYSGSTLGSPVTILENIPGSNDHNSARLAVGPDLKLYYTAGDMGAGQFENQSRTNNAQNLSINEGKVLRLNTESVGGSWIPTDNPVINGSQRNAIYSFGHRNPQGLVWGNVNGADILYSSEHGPYSDDEINLIEAGRNYGWPNVIGFCDNNYNGRTTGGYAMSNEQANCTSLNVKEPLRSIFPSANPPQEGSDNMGWPSTAPSGMDFYGSDAIPGWQNSLLVAMLKSGTITRFKLSNNGLTIISDTIHYFRGKGRFRDVVVSPDGLKIYVACDSSGSTSGPTGGVTSSPANAGSILEFTYVPQSMGRGYIVSEEVPVTEDKKDRSIDVYPNPASSYVIVYNYGSTAGRTIEMIDMNGKMMKRQSVTNLATRLDIGNLSNGLYILRVTDEKGKTIRTEKVIVQK